MMDALAALRCWAVEVTLDIDGQPTMFRIEPAPAADWLIATLQQGHMSYLPGMLDEMQRNTLMDALADGTLTSRELIEGNRSALEQASGWRWWQAARLIATLSHQWAILGGLLLANGVNPATQPLGAVLGAVYSHLWQAAGKKEDRDQLTRKVLAPPQLDMPADVWESEEDAEEAIWQMMAAAQQNRAT